MSRRARMLAALGLLAYGLAAVSLLLTPVGSVPSTLLEDTMATGRGMGLSVHYLDEGTEVALNVLAFVPLTFLGSILRPSVRVGSWTTGAFLMSSTVELLQTLLPERLPSASDVVANTAGALVGAVLGWLVVRWSTSRKRTASED